MIIYNKVLSHNLKKHNKQIYSNLFVKDGTVQNNVYVIVIEASHHYDSI